MDIRNKQWFIVLLHVLGWIVYFSFPLLLHPTFKPHPHDEADREAMNLIPYFRAISNGLLIPLFYLNTEFVYERFLLRKKYYAFILLQIGIGGIYFLMLKGMHTWIFTDMRIHLPWPFFLSDYAFVTLVAYLYMLLRDSLRNERLQKEKENENLKSELSFLRWQISPHFLFNVLNNMVSLSNQHSEKLTPSLIQLSTLMRYMIYQYNDVKVSLHKEIEYIKSYIELQSLRYGDEITIEVQDNVPPDSNYEIEPMLLIPFVENAFKHGGTAPRPIVMVSFSIQEDQLLFSVRNKFIHEQNQAIDDTKGIGLNNVRRRLNLLYANDYSLSELVEDGWYKIFLNLSLK